MFYFFRPYKNYKEYINDWDIRPLKDARGAEFWQYMYCTHEKNLALNHNVKTNPNMPEGWKSIKKGDALKNLNSIYAA